MDVLRKSAIFGGLTALACLAAALFGAIHNQISLTFGPDYFHTIKFVQFGLGEALPDRVGAALVGVLASWWMGLIIGPPAFLFGLALIRAPGRFFNAGLRAIGAVFGATMLAAFIGAGIGFLRVSQGIDPGFYVPPGANPADIVRAGSMHNASYTGGAIGLVLALGMVWRARDRREPAHAA